MNNAASNICVCILFCSVLLAVILMDVKCMALIHSFPRINDIEDLFYEVTGFLCNLVKETFFKSLHIFYFALF